ncbi:HPP family protein [Priestia megaterium]|uniref:HPP family protein n=1 Tax=Priestia megaterium TaxID=1404 RepID=UPI0020794A55|nr:HPP family protein [Priestia megaterium]MDR7246240.1 CBS-domain-containing membrane protein [Priestia megaterium]USL45520.1 HPP family protein [Priestia megaterium]
MSVTGSVHPKTEGTAIPKRSFFSKMVTNTKSPLKINLKDASTGLIGGLISILALGLLTDMTPTPWLMAPFGASCVLAFGVWNAPLSQPRNIIGGHLVATLVGLVIYHAFGNNAWTLGLAVGLAIALMMLTKTTHPPAGADPIVVILGGVSWSYIITPVLIGSLLIVLVALVVNNLRSDRAYPTFWL